MPDDSPKSTFECRLIFSEVNEENSAKRFNSVVSLIEENKKQYFPEMEIEIGKERKYVAINGKLFAIFIDFEKINTLSIFIEDPEKDAKEVANEIFSKFINIHNTVLGEEANCVRVDSSLVQRSMEKSDFPLKVIGEQRMVQLNELAGKTLRPIILGFDYKDGDKQFMLTQITTFDDKSSILCSSRTKFKDKVPFNIFEKELIALEEWQGLLKKLEQV